jgi:5-methylcytosine-specific restriction endonuclease McrA
MTSKRYRDGYTPVHGTKNGYDWHRRGAFEEPCIECRQAMMLYWVNRRKNHGNPRRARYYGSVRKPYTVREVLETYGTSCHICSEPINLEAPRQVGLSGWEKGLHLDHLIPLSKGGEDTLDNIRPSHGQCNIIKWAKLNWREPRNVQ